MTALDPPAAHLVFDQSGRCISPNLHDGYLEGLILHKPHAAELLVQEFSGTRWRVSVPNIEYLRAVDVREGNIIFGMSVNWKQRGNLDMLEFVLSMPLESEYSQHAQVQIAEGNWALLYLTCSYGCDLAILTRSTPDRFGLEKR
jgi:hypothetical protein